jgi:hypothetical protein
MNSALSIDQLRALFRAIGAAKFTRTPSDLDLLTSKNLADASQAIGQLILHEDIKKWGAIAQKNWDVWYWLTPERTEWAQALENGSSLFSTQWNRWSQSHRLEMIRLLICPYGIQGDLEPVFLSALNAKLI